MLKAAGAFLIVLACTLAGRVRARELHRRARLLAALAAALELLRGEVVSRLAPLPEAAERLAASGPAETRDFFTLLVHRMGELGERPFSEIWDDCVAALALRPRENAALRDLGANLGRYGAEAQDAALGRCMALLGSAAAEAEAEAARGGKLSVGLGLTAGLMLAVLLS